MDAILLCAGFATRLHPLTKNTSNALLEVAGKPVLDYLMAQLVELDDVSTIHLVSNSRFTAHFYRWAASWRDVLARRGVKLLLHNDGTCDEEHRLGEVGDLAFVLRLIDEVDGALVLSGDTIYRFPLAPIWDDFRASDEHVVLALPETHAQVLSQRSVIEITGDGYVEKIHHHPEDPPSRQVCPPLYFLQRSGLDRVGPYLNGAGDRDTLDLFIDYLARHEPVKVVRMTDRDLRLRINTRYMYDKANELLAEEALLLDDGGREAR